MLLVYQQWRQSREVYKTKMDKYADPTNPVLIETLELLEKQDQDIWSAVRENLGKVNRDRPEVNISQVERITEEGDTVVIPGKLLGSGRLTKEVNVAAFSASKSARQQVEDEGGEYMFIRDLVEENPEGSEVKIVK